MAELLDFDPDSGMMQFVGNEGGKTIVKCVQDVEPVLDQNQRLRSNQESGWRGEMHHVASIPKIIIDQWWKELGDNPLHRRNRKWFVAKLNNTDFSKFRTKDGRI